MDGQIRRLDAEPVTLENYRPKPQSSLREAQAVGRALRPLPELVVTTNPSGPNWIREQFLARESAGALAAEFRSVDGPRK